MGTASVVRKFSECGGRIVSAVFSFGVLASAVSAQDVAPCASAPAAPPPGVAAPASPVAPVPGAGSEAERLDRLAARLAERRSVLDQRREKLARERDRLLAVDRPASDMDIKLWSDCATRGSALEMDVKVLQKLTTVLSLEALEHVSAPETNVASAFKADVGWARTRLQVALRSAPDNAQEGMKTLEEGILVVRLASGEAWSVVATVYGIGFVPSSQLQSER